MALQQIRIGNAENIYQYDDAAVAFTSGIDCTAPISADSPVNVRDCVTLSDLPTLANILSSTAVIADHAIVRGDGGARIVQGSVVFINDSGDIIVPDNFWIGLGAAAGRIEFDNQALDEINFLNCRVGIGTSTPTYNLHIVSASAPKVVVEDTTNTCQVRLESENTDGNVGTQSNHAFNIISNNTIRLYILNDGRVGKGIVPTAQFHIGTGTTAAGTGQFKLGPTTLLTTPEPGVMEFANSRFYITNVAHRRAIDRTSDVAVATATVENTIVETALWTGTMNANSLVAGNVFKFHADGVVQNGGPTAADRVTLRIRVGGIAGAIVATLSPIAGAMGANTIWHIDANATQRTIGAAAPRAVHIDLLMDTTEVHVIGVANIDTTANMDVVITAQWASADVANIISLYQGFMEYKN